MNSWRLTVRHRGVAGADSTSRSDRIIPTTRFHVEQMKIEIFRLFPLFCRRKQIQHTTTLPMKTAARIIIMQHATHIDRFWLNFRLFLRNLELFFLKSSGLSGLILQCGLSRYRDQAPKGRIPIGILRRVGK